MEDKKIILIPGGAGYIGSHAVVAFEQAGYKTVIIDNLVNSSRDALVGIEKILGYCPDFYECDIRDRQGLESIFEKYEFDGVIHFAGLKAVGESCKNIHLYHDNNISGSIVLFGIMEKYFVRRIIFSSSATVYHIDNPLPWTEGMSTGTTNPYGTTKLVIEKIIEDYTRNFHWSATILRYFNPIGAHPSGHIGENPSGVPNNLLPYIMDVVKGKQEYLMVYGNDYDTRDGTGIRDYIDVNDLVNAHIMSYEKMSEGYELYNVGTGYGVSVLEMIQVVEEVTKQRVPYKIKERRDGDMGQFWCSAEKIQKQLGWNPERSILNSIENTFKYGKKNQISHEISYF